MPITHAFSNALADATGTVTVWNGGTTASVAASDIVKPSNWNSAHALLFSAGGNTANQSTFSSNDMAFAASGDLSVGFSNGSLFYSARNGWLSQLEPFPVMTASQQQSFNDTNTMSIQSFVVPMNATFDYIRIPSSLSPITYTTGTANSTNTASWAATYRVGLYSQGSGADSDTIYSVATTSFVAALQQSFSVGTNSSAYTISLFVTLPGYQGTGAYQTTLSTTGSSASMTQALTNLSLFSGANLFDIPFAGSLTPGLYIAMLNRRTTTGGTNAVSFAHSIYIQSYGFTTAFSTIGGGANNSIPALPWMGRLTGIGSGGADTYARSALQSGANIQRTIFQLIKGF